MQFVFFFLFFLLPNDENSFRYVELMLTVMSDDCRYLVETVVYEEAKRLRPPHTIPAEALRELFGENKFAKCLRFVHTEHVRRNLTSA